MAIRSRESAGTQPPAHDRAPRVPRTGTAVPREAGSLAKGIRILGCFDPQHTTLRVSEVARLVGTDKGTASRLLRQLAAAGLVEDTGDGYRLGWRIGEMGALRQAAVQPGSSILATLAALSGRTASTVQFVVYNRELHRPVITFAVEGPRRLRVASEVGAVVPIHATAAGLAIGAVLDDEELQEAMQVCDWKAYTNQTMTDPASFCAALAETRERGYAIVKGAFFEEQHTIAGAIRVDSEAYGAVAALLVPGAASMPAQQEEIGREVTAAAQIIEAEMRGIGGARQVPLSDT